MIRSGPRRTVGSIAGLRRATSGRAEKIYQHSKSKSTASAATAFGITRRRVQQIVALYELAQSKLEELSKLPNRAKPRLDEAYRRLKALRELAPKIGLTDDDVLDMSLTAVGVILKLQASCADAENKIAGLLAKNKKLSTKAAADCVTKAYSWDSRRK